MRSTYLPVLRKARQLVNQPAANQSAARAAVSAWNPMLARGLAGAGMGGIIGAGYGVGSGEGALKGGLIGAGTMGALGALGGAPLRRGGAPLVSRRMAAPYTVGALGAGSAMTGAAINNSAGPGYSASDYRASNEGNRIYL
jgi:hypothetical protein